MALDLKEKISCIWHFAIPVFHPKLPKWQHFVKDSEYQLYQIWYNGSKQCICIYNCETRHFHRPGNAWFLLVEALPQSPVNTGLFSENAARNAAATRFCKSLNLTVKNR